MDEETVDGCVPVNGKQNICCSKKDGSVSETVIVIPEKLTDLSSGSSSSVEAADVVRNSENQSSGSGESCATRNVIEERVSENKERKKSWVIDVNYCRDGEICEEERVCRICHLNCEQEQPLKLVSLKSQTDLISLGCGCKGELSVAHLYCAEAWFKLKGNRICEICGQAVNNVRGVGNESFMDEWRESRLSSNAPESSDRSEEGCWHGQPLCNFLMACLVFAFILPWFFRINFW